MNTETFNITYKCPVTNQIVERTETFDDSIEFPAEKWVDDVRYVLADKGWYTITEVKPCA